MSLAAIAACQTNTTGALASLVSGLVHFKVPPVSGGEYGKLSQAPVLFEVKLGLISRSVGFSLQYTPVIQGPCVISTFYPRESFKNVDTVSFLMTCGLLCR